MEPDCIFGVVSIIEISLEADKNWSYFKFTSPNLLFTENCLYS